MGWLSEAGKDNAMMGWGHLDLLSIRLRPNESWGRTEDAIWFLFPDSGFGEYVSGTSNKALANGDVLVIRSPFAGKLYARGSNDFSMRHFSASAELLFPLFTGREICQLRNVLDNFKSARHFAAADPLAAACRRILGELPQDSPLDRRSQLLTVVTKILSGDFAKAHSHRNGFTGAEEHMVHVFERLDPASF